MIDYVVSMSACKQREAAKLVFGTDSFLATFRKLAKKKNCAFDTSKIVQLLQFLENASDADLFDFMDSGKAPETLRHIETICGRQSLLEFNESLKTIYVPLATVGYGAVTSKDIYQEAEATKQKIKNIRPANISAAKGKQGRYKHPESVQNVGTTQIRASR